MSDDLGPYLAQPENVNAEWLTGVVIDGNATPPLIDCDGDGVGIPTECLNSYRPTDGDRVIVHTDWDGQFAATRFCLGRIGKGSGVSLGRTATQSATGAASTPVSWDTEIYDQGGYWTSGTNITIPTGAGGVYVCYALIVGAGSFTADSNIDVLVNGTAMGRFYNNRNAPRLMVTTMLILVPTDVVTVEVFNNGTTQNMTGNVNLVCVA